MLFSTPLFLFAFFPLVLFLFFIVPKQYRNLVLFIMSICFFLWGEPIFTWIILLSASIDWVICNLIYNTKEQSGKRWWLGFLGIFLNVALLAYYKYANFFFTNVNMLLENLHLGHSITWTKVLLPLGVSFLVFEKITYIVDVYKNEGKPAKILDYLTYIFLFPKLLAGPIVKYHEIRDQLQSRTTNIDNVYIGFYRFCYGLCKKVFIADTMSEYVDKVFALPLVQVSTEMAWFAALSFTIQIYFDFSGYSDMAIGMAKIFGFDLRENFNMPYIATNFTDFWKRWHISLSTWIKEYIYIPLGGNRVSTATTYRNLIISFFLSGLWHGANWTFIFWGLYHGLFLVIDRVFWKDMQKHLPRFINVCITFFFLVVGWVFFRAVDIHYGLGFVFRMFSYHGTGAFLYVPNNIYFFFVLACFLIFIPLLPKYSKMEQLFHSRFDGSLLKSIFGILLAIMALAKVLTTTFNPFLYFRF